MSKPRARNQALEALRPALNETGLPWATEDGKKHTKVRLSGRVVAVLSRGGRGEGCHLENTKAAIRRAAKELRG